MNATRNSAEEANTMSEAAAGAAVFEFRWDVEVPPETDAGRVGEKGYGERFMKQWRKMLTVQRMAPLVSKTVAPRRARYQLCVAGEAPGESVTAREKEITRALSRLSWGEERPSDSITGEPAGNHPAGWQGVRVWIAFAREDIEKALGKQAKF
jgi:hypothetical protein